MAVIGFLNYRDYGVGWDEEAQREVGRVAYNYAFKNDAAFESFICREHGAFWEVVLYKAERLAGFTQKHDIYFLRHALNHALFLCGAFFIFMLVRRLYDSLLTATIAFLLIIFHPVIYAHSFFNSKDVPFLSLMMIGFYFFYLAFETGKYKHVLFLGVIAGLMTSVRLTGLLFMATTLLFCLIQIIRYKEKKKHMLQGVLFSAVALATLYAAWPLLWKDPVANFKWVFSVMASYPFDGTLLFEGEFIKAPDLPWYYVPLWFVISTPFVFLVTGFAGLIVSLFFMRENGTPGSSQNTLFYNLLFTGSFIFPVISIILLDSVVYDGWRHMFFIYPPFALLAAAFFEWLRRKTGNSLTVAAAFFALVPALFFMIRNHPVQFVHFNFLVNRNTPQYLRHQYELDYWGVAYKQGLEIILRNDTSSHIKISSQNPPCDLNLELLPEKDRQRFSFTIIEESDYFLTNYRWHPRDYDEPALKNREWRSVSVQNNAVNMIYKLKKD